jgi:hypothetical protein
LVLLTDTYTPTSDINVHLRASAGRPSHVLVPHPPEWRWSAAGSSPWFPDAKVYRQRANHNWSEGLEALTRHMAKSV